MNTHQAIPHPVGVSVFGSAMVRVEPDIASIHCAVVALKMLPKESFAEVQRTSEKVRSFLARANMSEVASSRISLKQEFRFSNGENRFAGYLARVGFHILLRDLERVEEILVGVVDAGASEISNIDLQTTRLKELRADARKQAIVAARTKAIAYCEAAGVGLGNILHIEDLNPDTLHGAPSGHLVAPHAPLDDHGPIHAFDPGAISVAAAVQVVFAMAH